MGSVRNNDEGAYVNNFSGHLEIITWLGW